MKKYFFIFIVAFFASCSPVEQDVIITIETETVLNDCYIGNGAQWDPYQLDYGKGKLTISEADWEKLYDRLDFMRPQFIRIMINTSSFVDQGRLVPERGMEVLSKMLDYCQSRNVTVMFGDWGWSVIRTREAEIDSQSLRHAAALVDYLVHIGTSKLNEVMLPIIEAYPPQSIKGKYIKIKYCTQLPNTTIPSFVFYANLPQYVKENYRRFLENKIRENWSLHGCPINVFIRQK